MEQPGIICTFISYSHSQFVGGSSGQDSTGQHQQQFHNTVPSGAPVFSHGQVIQGRVRMWGGKPRAKSHGKQQRDNERKRQQKLAQK